jgi:RHS repeat-associated protein
VVSKRTRGAQLIDNSYDTLNRLNTRLVPQSPGNAAILTTYSYDLAGRTTQVSDNAGHILAYAFDTAKRPASVTQTAPGVTGTRIVSYQLDPAGNKTRATWADGYYVQYQFDQLNRVTTATENGTFLLATYIYDPLSRRSSLVYGNGASKSYAYTTQGDMTSLAHTLTGTSATYTNTYTKAHQLASENLSNAAWQFVPAVFQATAYSADNTLNQYVNVTVGGNPAATMAYDANGNLAGDGVWTFAYDAQNMLRVATSAGTTASYAYDPLGRRQAKTVNAVVTTFLSDGDEEIADYAESGGASTLLRRYVPGPGTDMPIAMVTPSGGGNTRSYFHTNRQGSTVAMSADNGTMSEGPYTYDAYGIGAATTGVPFKYTGRRLDPETRLYYYRARYYSAALGRFLQTDPVGYDDQMNLYLYVADDPINATDPTGEILDTIADIGFLAYENLARRLHRRKYRGASSRPRCDRCSWSHR